MSRLSTALLFLLLALPLSLFCAQEQQGDEPPPSPPEPFPAAYQDDQILPTSVSPDGHYGLIYQRYELSTEREGRLLLVELKPFRVLSEISHDISLEHGHNSYCVNWAKNSSAVVVNAETKWGPDKVFLVPIRNGQAGKVAELIAAVDKLVRPAYKKAKAQRHGEASVDHFNDDTDFIFEADYLSPGKGDDTHESWVASEAGKVTVTCFCTNNPKIPDLHTWTVRFDGTWDIAKRRFTQQKIASLPFTTGKSGTEQ